MRKIVGLAAPLTVVLLISGCLPDATSGPEASALRRARAAGASRQETASVLLPVGWLDSDLPPRVRRRRGEPAPRQRPAAAGDQDVLEELTGENPAPRPATRDESGVLKELTEEEPALSEGMRAAAFPLDPIDSVLSNPWAQGALAVSIALASPVKRDATRLDNGTHATVHYHVEFTPYQTLELALGFFRADVRPVLSREGLPLSTGQMESISVQVGYQIGSELSRDVGRVYISPGAGVFFLDKDEVGESVDLGLKAAAGIEFWSLHHPVRTQLEFAYLRLMDIEEEFYLSRLSLIVKF